MKVKYAKTKIVKEVFCVKEEKIENPPNFVKPQIWVKYVIFTSFLPRNSKSNTNLGVLC